MAEAHANLASAYKDREQNSGHVEVAIKSYKHALFLRPNFLEATCNLLHALHVHLYIGNAKRGSVFRILCACYLFKCVCDWDEQDEQFMEIEAVVQRQIKMRLLPSVQPFHAIAYPIDAIFALEISQKYAEHCTMTASRYGAQLFMHPAGIPVKSEGGSGRLRIGYVSSDFRNHPLSHLMGNVFGMYNCEYVEVFYYALRPNDGSKWRQRISAEAE